MDAILIHIVTRVREMEEIVEEKLGKDGELTTKICEEFGLKEYDPAQYLELETLGSGAFGIVRKCKFIPQHELHAVKMVKIHGIKKSKIIQNIGSYFVETEISKRILTIKNPNLASFKDNCFILDSSRSKIESLVLITEAGDYSLKDLLDCRISQNKFPPYSPDEALRILVCIAKAFRALQQNRIYHSDIKLANIIYSQSANKFLIIDFGVSNIVPLENELPEDEQSSDEIKLAYLVRGGTKEYNSPEKAAYLLNQDSDELFNPFKCDMWALGVCLEQMLGFSDVRSPKIEHPLLLKILDGLKKFEWRNRYDAESLSKDLIDFEWNLSPNLLDLADIENEFLQILKKKTFDENKKLLDLYAKANMPTERLEIASHFMTLFEKRYKGIVNAQNWTEYDDLLREKGKR